MIPVIGDLLFFLGFVSAGLSWCIAYLMLVSYRTLYRKYLLGFPFGFSFLGLSFASFGISQLMVFPENLASWIALLLGTYGYLSISLSYALKKEPGAGSTESRMSDWVFFTLTVLATIVVLALLFSTPILPSYQLADSGFRVVDFGLLAYIIYSLNQALRDRTELSSVVLGFTFLAIQQCIELLWALDRTFVFAFLFAQLVAFAGLLILVIVLVKGFRGE
ncbi:MAG: hypothetical protein ABSC50_01875 [Candidatus Bathyarchaeia archaeon]